MPLMTAEQALMAALHRAMVADGRVIFLGPGVATRCPALLAAFGAERVRNTPLAEAALIDCALGAAAMGLRPVVDLPWSPLRALDALENAARLSQGGAEFPLVLLARSGAEAVFAQLPGLQVLMPSTPADAAGLLAGALSQPRPSLLFSDVGLAVEAAEVAGDELVLPGQALIRHHGDTLTLVACGAAVPACLAVAPALDADVIDLRSLRPLDTATVLASVRRTGRLVCVGEAGGMAAELCALVAEHAFTALKAPPLRLTHPDEHPHLMTERST